MHQYTADLANRVACEDGAGRVGQASDEAFLVTTVGYPADRYSPAVEVHTLLHTTGTGFSGEGLRLRQIGRIAQHIVELEPDAVHFTGPHLWNVTLLRLLSAQGIPTIHTLHDLDPHKGSRFGALLPVWNSLVLRAADTILVHGACYRSRLIRRGLPVTKVVHTPLLHLCLSYERQRNLAKLETDRCWQDVDSEPSILFFGRLEAYKGIDVLLTAYAELVSRAEGEPDGRRAIVPRLVLAGPGDISSLWAGAVPANVVLRNELIGDEEALDLFRRCSLLVLPYTDATQSALIAAAYYFHKPVIVSRIGALPEYVVDQETGFVVEPGHPPSLERALEIALAEPNRLRRMGDAGRDWYDHRRLEEWGALMRMYLRAAACQQARIPFRSRESAIL
jgi:glycosyltransferase involved in cell wall biosynthesis